MTAGDERERKLTPDREEGTEPEFSEKYVSKKDDGIYVCAGCGKPAACPGSS